MTHQLDPMTIAKQEIASEELREAVEAHKAAWYAKRKSLWSRFKRFIKTKKIVIRVENRR